MSRGSQAAFVDEMEFPINYNTSATVRLFQKISKIVYLSCAKNFWFEETILPQNFIKIYNKISIILEVLVVSFLASEWGSFITQKNLTEKQRGDLSLFTFSHSVVYFVYISIRYHRDRIRRLVFTLTVTLGTWNDEGVERAMIRKIWWYSIALVFVCSGSLFSYGVEICVEALTTNVTFTTVIPLWPDVEDRRPIAGATRILFYFIWWIFVVRAMATYLIILAITICLSHQFTKLHNYFLSLNDIFEGDGSQEEKERRYEDAVKVGIKMHSTSLWCVREAQVVCGVAFSGQIIINVTVLLLMMIQMMRTERTLVSVAPIVCVAMNVLVITGIFMWNAGDITVEAGRVPTAVYLSGWHHCRGRSSMRARRLLTFTMTQAQKPVIITVLGVIELSYQSYVSIVKASYSLFSVIY